MKSDGSSGCGGRIPRPDWTGHPTVRTPGLGATDNLFVAAVEMTRMPMIVTDPNQPDNPIVFANEAFFQMTGYGPGDVVGRNCRFLQGPETSHEAIAEVRSAIEQRTQIAVEVLNYRRDGSAFWNALYISPVFDEQGKLLYFFGNQLDVSRRHDAEATLHQAQKMEAVGQLTGGIAHDFNNLLTVIVGSLEGLAEGEQNPRRQRLLDRITQAANKGAALTQQLLAFARKQRLDERSTNLNLLVGGLTDMVRRTLGSEIEITTQLDPDLWTVRADAVQAELTLLNTLLNARDAIQAHQPRRWPGGAADQQPDCRTGGSPHARRHPARRLRRALHRRQRRRHPGRHPAPRHGAFLHDEGRWQRLGYGLGHGLRLHAPEPRPPSRRERARPWRDDQPALPGSRSRGASARREHAPAAAYPRRAGWRDGARRRGQSGRAGPRSRHPRRLRLRDFTARRAPRKRCASSRARRAWTCCSPTS